MRAGWMRPSWISFSSVSFAISRRTGSKAGQYDRRGRLVDDEVDARDVLERPDVAPLAADDPALHVVGRQHHQGHRGLRRVAGGKALHACGEHVARAPGRLAARLLLHLADHPRLVVAGLLLDLLQKCLPRLRATESGGALQLTRGLLRLRALARCSRCSSSRARSAIARSRPRGPRCATRATPRAGGCAPPAAGSRRDARRSASSDSVTAAGAGLSTTSSVRGGRRALLAGRRLPRVNGSAGRLRARPPANSPGRHRGDAGNCDHDQSFHGLLSSSSTKKAEREPGFARPEASRCAAAGCASRPSCAPGGTLRA